MAAYHWEARRRQITMEHRLRLMQVVGSGRKSCADKGAATAGVRWRGRPRGIVDASKMEEPNNLVIGGHTCF